MASPGVGHYNIVWWGALFMLSILIKLMVGLLLGVLAGLGVGGGSLLILWLTLVAGADHHTARAINLMFFIAAAGAVSIFRWKNGKLDIISLLPGILSGCIAAFCSSWLSTQIDQNLIRKLFGILLLATGIRELFYRPRKAR